MFCVCFLSGFNRWKLKCQLGNRSGIGCIALWIRSALCCIRAIIARGFSNATYYCAVVNSGIESKLPNRCDALLRLSNLE